MRIKSLLFLLAALPLAFVACKQSTSVDDVKSSATIDIVAGEATDASLSFTVTSADAEVVKYIVVESAEGTPTATEVLSNGKAIEANKSVVCTEDNLKAETEYTIVAAAQNVASVVKKEIKMTTAKGGEEPEPPTPGDEYDVDFTAQECYIAYYADMYSDAYNYYVIISDVGVILGDYEISYKDNGTYYILDFYAADAVEITNFTLPNGTYKAATSSAAGTFGVGDYGATLTMVNGEPIFAIYESGNIVVSDNKIEGEITMEDGTKHHILYEGSLYFGDNGEEPEPPTPGDDFEATHTATKWLWGGPTSYGNKYAVIGDNFSLDIHFPTQYAQQTALAEGEYIWTSTSWFGYNDFDNEFTTRSFNVDGTDVAVDAGSVLVVAQGDEYHIEVVLEGRDGNFYAIEYNGKLDDKGTTGGDDEGPVTFTYMSNGSYNTMFWCYEYELTNDKGDTMVLLINDTQGSENNIYSDDSFAWTTRDYCYYAGDFSTYGIKVGGMSYDAISGAMALVSDNNGTIEFNMSLNFSNGSSREFVFAGKMGEENGGGTTPSEPTKLATPSVSGIVAGNSATISWQDVAGAKDYTVTLNGTQVDTVSTPYIVYTDLEYNTTYSVSVVANPADTSLNTASDAGTATFTTEADNGGGSGDGGNTGSESFENWVFSATLNQPARLLTLTDGTRTVTFTLSEIAGATFYINGTGTLNATNVTVDGVETNDASGYVQMLALNNYHVVIDAVINGVKYTGTSSNAVV